MTEHDLQLTAITLFFDKSVIKMTITKEKNY